MPESARWEHEKARGATSHWQNADLFGVLIGCVASLGIIVVWSPAMSHLNWFVAAGITVVGLAIAMLGYLYPVRKYLSRAVSSGSLVAAEQKKVLGHMLLGAALASVALLGTWGSIQWAPRWAGELQPNTQEVKYYAKEKTQIATSLGAIVATMLAALAAGAYGRRITYMMMCLGSVLSALYFYQFNQTFGTGFLIAAFMAGGITASFYGFFPLYFPELFPTAVRATGQGFAFNFGRIVAAIGGLQTAALMTYFGDSFPKAGSVMASIYVVGMVIIWFGPETKKTGLSDA